MQDFTDEQVAEMVGNIDKYDDINGDPEKQSQPEQKEQEQQEQVEPGAQPLTFKTYDDLLKHKLKYKSDMGKEVEEDLATVLQRASAGYHFAQRMNEYNQLMTDYKSKYEPSIQEANALKEKYGKFEEYAKENPQWYDHWSSAWENRHNQMTETGEMQEEQPSNIQAILKDMLAQELGPVRDFMSQQQQTIQSKQIADEDRALSDAVDKTRKEFSQVDFDKTDPQTGESLEYQVLKFMHQSGIQDFNTAFKAFYHDNIVKMQVEQAREQALRDDQERKKNGIIDIQTTPVRRTQPNLKNLNLDQAMELALKDRDIFGTG